MAKSTSSKIGAYPQVPNPKPSSPNGQKGYLPLRDQLKIPKCDDDAV